MVETYKTGEIAHGDNKALYAARDEAAPSIGISEAKQKEDSTSVGLMNILHQWMGGLLPLQFQPFLQAVEQRLYIEFKSNDPWQVATHNNNVQAIASLQRPPPNANGERRQANKRKATCEDNMPNNSNWRRRPQNTTIGNPYIWSRILKVCQSINESRCRRLPPIC